MTSCGTSHCLKFLAHKARLVPRNPIVRGSERIGITCSFPTPTPSLEGRGSKLVIVLGGTGDWLDRPQDLGHCGEHVDPRRSTDLRMAAETVEPAIALAEQRPNGPTE